MTKNKKQRAAYGAFYLTSEDIASFRQKKESARAIAQRKGTSSSLVAYHLRKLNDEAVNAVLRRNALKPRSDFEQHKLAKVREMILAGHSVLEVITECRVSSSTVTRTQKELGLYVEPPKPKRKTPAQQGTVYGLLTDVMDTPVFKILTGRWPVTLERTGETA